MFKYPKGKFPGRQMKPSVYSRSLVCQCFVGPQYSPLCPSACSSCCLFWDHLSSGEAEVLCGIHGTNLTKVKPETRDLERDQAHVGADFEHSSSLSSLSDSVASTPGYLFGKRILCFLFLMCIVGIFNYLLISHYGSDYKEYVETITSAASALLLIP